MPAYLAPGVYLRPKRTSEADVRLVRTDVAAFIGFTERGPLPLDGALAAGTPATRADDLAVRLTSWDEFRAVFGGLTRHALLPFAVRGFFENHGTTCYVVRVAAVTQEDRSQRPNVARWVFRGTADPLITGSLLSAVPAGASALRTTLAGDLLSNRVTPRSTLLVELVPADGSASDFFVHVGTHPDVVHLSGPVRRDFSSGSTIRLHEAALEIAAASAGNWGNRIRLDVTPLETGGAVKEFALRVRVEPGPDPSHPREQEFYRALSLEPRDRPRRPAADGASVDRTPRRNPLFAPDHINARSRLIRVVYPLDGDTAAATHLAPAPIVVDAAGELVHLVGGKDGLAGLSGAVTGAVPADWLNALQLVDSIDEVAILCAPDIAYQLPPRLERLPLPASPPCAPPRPETPPDVVAADATAMPAAIVDDAVLRFHAAILEQCERRRDRVAIVDPPASARTAAELLAWRSIIGLLQQSSRRFAATYGPWLDVSDPTRPVTMRRRVPPCGHIAGVYAQIDNEFGVQRPPANVALAGVIDLAEPLTALDQEALNPRGINLIRSFPGRGVRVWGARSLSDEAEWRFIHVRRLMSMIEESVEDSTQWVVFEPNDDALRRTLVHSLSVFLGDIWERGGLKGSTTEEAFYVRCDDTNNPPSVTNAGQLICTIGVAIAAPMEFLVFEIRQRPEGAAIVEA